MYLFITLMDTITILGRDFPVYSFLGAIGFLLGIVFLIIISKKKNILFDDTIYVYVYAMIAALIGAKVLYLLVSIPTIIDFIRSTDMGTLNIIKVLLSGGFVFYGGAICAVLGAYLACRFFKLEPFKMIDLAIPTLPLVHAFGRIGCHFAGCCYGRETAGKIFITYHGNALAPNEVHLLPVQLFEAGYEFILFAVLGVLLWKDQFQGKLYKIYFVAYGIFRFIIEFFRGDAARGLFFGISTSQWISLGLIVYVVLSELLCRKKQELLE